MTEYNYFAQFYDNLTDNVEYEKRIEYIKNFLPDKNSVILDLACGTGSMSLPLLKSGYRIIGLDLSDNMLEIASNKFLEVSDNFSLMKGNMRNFCLGDKADACICCLDSINHLTDINGVKDCFLSVFNSLKNNSVFVFDVNTIYKHNNILSDKTFIFDEDDYYIVWDNENEGNDTVRILLDIFVYNGSSYDRYNEEFFEKAYGIDELKKVLIEVGFKDIAVYDELSFNEPRDDCERLYFVCKKGD